VVSIRKSIIAAVVGAAVLATAACTTASGADGGSGSPHSVVSPSRTSTQPANSPASTTPKAPKTPTPPATDGPIAGTPEPGIRLGSFSLDITTQSGPISAGVEPISVDSGETVDPPHSTNKEWKTAAWVQQSTFPTDGDQGTSYVYGHACHYHVCSFTNLKNVRVGDQVTVKAISGQLNYVVSRVGLSPKAAKSLPSWASDSTVPNRLVLVTCAFEQGDNSTENIVVVAKLKK
jgi:LPXTG-site transpeptidase (sortase) family protein